MIFSSLDLAPEIQQALDACGYREMTAIQQQEQERPLLLRCLFSSK